MTVATGEPLTVLILAAGEGTRMRSVTTAKVLHTFAGRSLLGHVHAAVAELEPNVTAVVVGHRAPEVTAHLAELDSTALAVLQAEQNGTGHAVRVALTELGSRAGGGTVMVVPADAPLLRAQTLRALLKQHQETGAAATLLSSVVTDPTGYGRVIRSAEAGSQLVTRVVEHRDASDDELAVMEVAAGVYAFAAGKLRDALEKISTDNAQGEEYLPDVVGLLMAAGEPVHALIVPAVETAGVNDRMQLAAAHRLYNDQLLNAHMRAGVRIVDPATTWIDADVEIAADAVIEPGVQLHGVTRISAGARIGPDSTLTDTTVGTGSVLHRVVAVQASVGADITVGPFAYLRPGTVLHDGAHVGTYVEIKNSVVGEGSKVPHLTYVGDGDIGVHTNIGASTVFVNYDGASKHRTHVGDHVFIGSDTMLIAPVTIGDGAQTAAGSTIYEDVPPGALAVARARQRNVENWVQRSRPDSAAAAAARAASPAHAQSDPASTETGPNSTEESPKSV